MQSPQHHFVDLLHSQYDLKEFASMELANWTDRHVAKWLDSRDPLGRLRDQFHIPRMRTLPHVDPEFANGEEENAAYLCGNSVGLQPKCTERYIQREMRQWAEMGVYGHFSGPEPWTRCDDRLLDRLAQLVGANSAEEVGLMNSTTVNIHLLFAAFFRPNASRYKVLIEAKAFPSDHYAVESQLRMKGLDPAEAMICLEPRESEDCLRTQDILAFLEREGHSVAILFFSGIHYFTGQLFDIARITQCAQAQGCLVGWDLSHVIGNVPIRLHEWGVDFACWCSYKYACASPGGIAGMFIHQRHTIELPSTQNCAPESERLLGWWAHRLETRFLMSNRMDLANGVAGFRLSTPSAILMAAMRGFLEVLAQTSMGELRHKSLLLTGYLEFLLDLKLRQCSNRCAVEWRQITPREAAERGNQLSLKFGANFNLIDKIHAELMRRGIVVDKRCPDVIRVAPTPLYNNFDDVWRFVQALCEAIEAINDEREQNKKI